MAALNRQLEDFSAPELLVEPAAWNLPILYIVGAPRSGTTLLSQLTSRFFGVGYISNLIAAFWSRPSVGVQLSKGLLGPDGRRSISFHSRHGVTAGIADPHEFGYFWRRWLPIDDHSSHSLPDGTRRLVDIEGLRQALEGELLGAFGLPMVFKNVICGFHPELLIKAHPRSVFIHIRRDEEATAASILRSRFERYGDYATWWSLKPTTYPSFLTADDPVAEVLAQVTDCQNEIDARLSDCGAATVHLDYEALCDDPRGALQKIASTVQATFGYDLPVLTGEWPALAASAGPKLPPSLDAALRQRATAPNSRS